MASPDIQPYVGLELYDHDPQDIFDIAVQNLQFDFPDWEPREGNVEVQLLEAISVAFAEVIFAINRLPDGIFEALLKFFGLERDIGAPPTVTLKFELGDDLGSVIPAGTTVTIDLVDGQSVDFSTDEELVVDEGFFDGTITATSSQYTSDANGTPINTLTTIVDSIASVDYVRTTTVVTGGIDPEEDEDFFTRGTQTLQRLTGALVLPYHFETFAVEQSYIERAYGIDNYNPTGDVGLDGPVGNDAGHMTIAVYGENETVSAPNKTLLLNAMGDLAYANLILHVIDPQITEFDVTATVQINSAYDQATVIAAIEAELRVFYNPMTWNWGSIVRVNELIALISNVEGVDYVTGMSAPASNITLTGVANLVRVDDVTITAV